MNERLRNRVVTAYICACCALVAAPALAGGDLWAAGIEVRAVGGGQFEVAVEYASSWVGGTGDFSYTLLATQWRNGNIVGVPLDRTDSCHPMNVCGDPCGENCPTGKCHYSIGVNPVNFEGSCGMVHNICPDVAGNRTLDGCSCVTNTKTEAFVVHLIANDVISFSVAPGPGFEDENPSNNQISISLM